MRFSAQIDGYELAVGRIGVSRRVRRSDFEWEKDPFGARSTTRAEMVSYRGLLFLRKRTAYVVWLLYRQRVGRYSNLELL